MHTNHVSLYEAKTHLSNLIDRVAGGEEIVIAKNGTPKARLIPLKPIRSEPRRPAGALGIASIAPDFDALDHDIVAMFEGDR